MHVVIRSFEQVIFDGFLNKIVLSGEDGELSIWDFHQTLITRLKKGDIKLGPPGSPQTKKIKINSGIAKFDHNELIVLCA